MNHVSYLARSALYMDWKYSLDVDLDMIFRWKYMAVQFDPCEFELERNELIKEFQGNDNPFVSDFPSKIVYY